MRKRLRITVICLFFLNTKVFSQNTNILHELNNLLINTVMDDIYSPPVSSRIYCYPHIAFYECMANDNPDYKTFNGKLNGYNNKPPAPKQNYDWFTAAAVAFSYTAQNLVGSEYKFEDWRNAFLDSVKKSKKEINIETSINYGKRVADSIITWSKKDNYLKSRGMMRYVIINKPGAWQPTPNDYAQGLEPHWNTIRPMVLDNPGQFSPKEKLRFSLNKKSPFYKNLLEAYRISKKLDSTKKSIALYWDDNPNVSVAEGHLNYFIHKISPGGHWLKIAGQAAQQKNLSTQQTSLVYTLTSIAIFDAFISCWDEKYKTNLVRPITIINQTIDKRWAPFIQTPPFPEFTSGHSVVSNAAATILTELIGDNFAFTDETEIPFNLKPRTFSSFLEAAAESSLSRVYGGIHYPLTAKISAVQGKNIGKFVINKLYK